MYVRWNIKSKHHCNWTGCWLPSEQHCSVVKTLAAQAVAWVSVSFSLSSSYFCLTKHSSDWSKGKWFGTLVHCRVIGLIRWYSSRHGAISLSVVFRGWGINHCVKTCHTLTLKPTASALFTPSRGVTVLLKSLRPANGTPRVEASMTRWRCNTAGLADRQTMPALRPSLSSSLLTELTPSTNWERFSFSWSAWGLGCWWSGVLWLLSVTTSSNSLLTSSKHCFLLGGSTQGLVPVSATSGGFSEVVFFVDFFFCGCRSANDLGVYGKTK